MDLSNARDRARRRAAARSLPLAALLALPAACAHAKPEPPAPPPPRPEHRSSVAAVLAHRDELGLTDDQVRELSAIEDKLQEANAALRAESRGASAEGPAERRAGDSALRAGTGRDETGAPLPDGMGAMTRPGAVPGMGRGSGHGSGGMGGPQREGSAGPPSGRGVRNAPRERMDENDAKAYLDAESLLTDAQRARAREIAEQYREQLFEWREAAQPKEPRGDDKPTRRSRARAAPF
jgi:hypothetical protein